MSREAIGVSSKDFVHREYFHGYQKVYWGKDNSACDKKDARCVDIRPGDSSSHHKGMMFYLPEQSGMIEAIEILLENAYEAGERAARLHIREALGIKEPRP